jgi:Domain of unknown function (DUF4258)
MFQRGMGRDAVLAVVAHGETIAAYADDKPYPSRLPLGFEDERPLHVVIALDECSGTCIVVTSYEPALDQWGADFRTRKTA